MNKHSPSSQKRRSRRKSASPGKSSIDGVISVHPRGFAFVATEQEKDIFIPPAAVGTALSDDRVRVRIESEDERGPVGRVEKILERGHQEIIGMAAFDPTDGRLIVRPLRRDLPATIPLCDTETAAAPGPGQPEEGDWISARLLFPETRRQSLQAQFLRTIAKPGSIAADLDAIAAEFDLLPAYDSAANQRAAGCQPQATERETLEPSAVVVTIDPEDAKDFDDAVSLHPGPNPESMVVGVHIADLAAYVNPGGELDAEAARRGFTAYLPGRTLHMLPPALAADQCSLREGVENLAHSVFLTVNCNTGNIVDIRRCRCRLTVTKRLSFEQVQALIDGESPAAIPETVAATVLSLHHLAETMRRHRQQKEQFLNLETREVRVLCDEAHARITGLKRATSSAADHMVEEFMLAANVAVAKEMKKRQIPALYRLHPEPKPVDLEEFVKWLGEIGIGQTGRLGSRRQINAFLRRMRRRHDAEIISSMFLRTLTRAFYSASPGPHYGLGKPTYAHFTSPIRRYPDLVVHQQLWAADHGRPGRDQQECARIAAVCTAQEKNHDGAYFAALDRLKIRYIQELRMEGQRLLYEGIVARTTGEGLIVFLPDLGIFGNMPKKIVPRKSGGKVWQSGNIIYVAVHQADPVRGQLTVMPAGG